MAKSNEERLASIEAHQEDIKDNVTYIRNNMVSKATVTILQWAIGISCSFAVTAIVMAANAN